MMVRMKAARSFRYATRMLSAGDEFEASRQDARVLSAIGNASEAPAAKVEPKEPPAPKEQDAAADTDADAEAEEADADDQPAPRRKRRAKADR